MLNTGFSPHTLRVLIRTQKLQENYLKLFIKGWKSKEF